MTRIDELYLFSENSWLGVTRPSRSESMHGSHEQVAL